jgi:hypothetical protein
MRNQWTNRKIHFLLTNYVHRPDSARVGMPWARAESVIEWSVKIAASNVRAIDFALEDPLCDPILPDTRINAIIERLKVR